MSDEPIDPISELAVGMTALHEMFKSLVAGGFEEKQAMYIISQVLLGSMKHE